MPVLAGGECGLLADSCVLSTLVGRGYSVQLLSCEGCAMGVFCAEECSGPQPSSYFRVAEDSALLSPWGCLGGVVGDVVRCEGPGRPLKPALPLTNSAILSKSTSLPEPQ